MAPTVDLSQRHLAMVAAHAGVDARTVRRVVVEGVRPRSGATLRAIQRSLETIAELCALESDAAGERALLAANERIGKAGTS